MKEKSLAQKIYRYIYIRYLVFKRKPLLMIRYLFMIVLFRLLGVIICVFLTIIPLPINHLLQNIFNLNLSFNSFKDILLSIKKIATVFNNLLPSFSDMVVMLKNMILNISSINPLNLLRELPSDLRAFFAQFFDKLRQRLNDLKIFLKELYPPKNILSKLKLFLKTHAIIVRRMFKALLMMLSSIIFVKILFLLIIPLLGIGAVYVVGFDISLIIIGILSLISSQLGSLLGRCINVYLLKLYEYLVKKRSQQYEDRENIIVVAIVILYAKIRATILSIRYHICDLLDIYLCIIKSFCLDIYKFIRKCFYV